MRIDEPGWEPISIPDPSGRRGLWMRRQPPRKHDGFDTSLPATVELCAGREGDDDYVKLSVGDTVTEKTLSEIEDLIRSVAFAEEHREWEIDWDNPNTQEVARLLMHSRRLIVDALQGIEKLRNKEERQ